MSIRDFVVGNILDPANPADIIIAMNAEFDDVTGIGKPFIDQIVRTRDISLGSVVSFAYGDTGKELHMLVCHHLLQGGWKNADQYVRFGLDFLWHADPNREYSIVNIGTGRVGIRDGADHEAIRTAITTSFLPVWLYILNEPMRQAAAMAQVIPLRPYRMWDMVRGEEQIRLAA